MGINVLQAGCPCPSLDQQCHSTEGTTYCYSEIVTTVNRDPVIMSQVVFQDFPAPLMVCFPRLCTACRSTSFFKHGQRYLRGTLLRTLYKLLCHFASNVSVTTNANVLEMSVIINS